MLHPHQVGVVLVVLHVNPHARVQFGRIQHAELGPVRDAVGGDELDGRAARTRVEHFGGGDTHVALDLMVVAPRAEDQQHRQE